MAKDSSQRMTLEDYSISSTPQYFTSIVRSEVQAANIKYTYSLIQLIHDNLFHGLPNEKPYTHLTTYIEICNTTKIAGVPKDVICLNLFSFSLVGEAKCWLHSFKGNNLRTQKEVMEKFLKKYFPQSKTAEGNVKISSFHQFHDESLSEVLDRFHGLLQKTSTHRFNEPIQLNIFIDIQLVTPFQATSRCIYFVYFTKSSPYFLIHYLSPIFQNSLSQSQILTVDQIRKLINNF